MITIFSLISALATIFIILAEHFGLYEKVKPYLVPEIVYLWTGKNYELKK